ncbi:hypothetical protein JCM10213v2_003236 [Rhodosporidiobolus nylandii]
MLDRLPIELLQHIFALLPSSPAPTAVDLAFDQSRLDALRTCCLVSQAVKAVAQEELWSVVRVTHVEGLRSVTEGIVADRARRTWGAVARNVEGPEIPSNDVVRALHTLAGLEELHLYYWNTPRTLDSLRRLVLEGLDLLSFLPNLPRLEELSLSQMRIARSSLIWALHPTTTPSLRAAAISIICDAESDGEIIPDLSATHLARLDGFQAFISSNAPIPPFLYSHITPTLATLDARTEPQTPFDAPHISLVNLPDYLAPYPISDGFWTVKENLVALTTYAAVRPRRLRTLFLPIFLHPSRRVPAAIEPSRDALLTACAGNSVDVHWRYPGPMEVTNALEPGWRKVARRIKAEAQEAARAAAERF